jgi:hypothetical protein
VFICWYSVVVVAAHCPLKISGIAIASFSSISVRSVVVSTSQFDSLIREPPPDVPQIATRPFSLTAPMVEDRGPGSGTAKR